jgi:ABC-2 type transport system permease protein
MIPLLSSELLRARSRKLVKVLLIVAVVGITVGVVIGAINSHKPSAAVVARAQAQRQADIKQCLAMPVPGGQTSSGMTRGQGCTPPLSAYLPAQSFDVNAIGDLLRGTSVNLIVMGWLVGASLAGAEWAAGTMTTLLTWEPRRIRVLLAKLVAAIVTVLLLTLALQLFLVGMLWLLAATRGLNVPDAGLWRGVFGSMLRVSAISAVAGLFGMAIAMYTRSVTAAMASGFIYLAVIEGLIRGYMPGFSRYLVGDNAAAWVSGHPFSATDPSYSVTVAHAVVVLLIYSAILVTAAAISFRGRDVT